MPSTVASNVLSILALSWELSVPDTAGSGITERAVVMGTAIGRMRTGAIRAGAAVSGSSQNMAKGLPRNGTLPPPLRWAVGVRRALGAGPKRGRRPRAVGPGRGAA